MRTPEIFMGEVSRMLKLEGILREVDEVMNALSEGKVVKAVHPCYSEVHWARKVNSSVVGKSLIQRLAKFCCQKCGLVSITMHCWCRMPLRLGGCLVCQKPKQ